jgi:mannose-6-phosphate isomerase
MLTLNLKEMWFGTYPDFNSYLLSSGEPLQDYMNKHKEELIGKNILNKFGEDLPFLPKVRRPQKSFPVSS